MGRPRKTGGQGLPKRVYLKHGAYYYVHATTPPRWERLGTDLAKVKKQAELFNGDDPTLGTLGWWLSEWLRTEVAARVAAGTMSERTAEDYTRDVEPVKAALGHLTPSALKTTHITAYLKAGRDMHRPVRANREKSALSSCISWMVEHEHAGLIRNVVREVKPNAETPRGRYITDTEYATVYDLASPAVRAWMEMMYRTLQRPSDILRWTTKNIAQEGGRPVLTFRQSKSEAMVKIEVSPTLQAALAQLAAARRGPSLYLIPCEDGSPYTESGIAAMMRRHVVASGIVDFAPYDCKAKGVCDMYQAGVPLAEISALCAHESVTTTEIYVKQHLKKVMKPNDRVVKAG